MIDIIKSEMLASFKASVDIEKPKLVTELEENSSIEFKKSLHTNGETIDKSYLSPIAGFANNEGGTIIFGIDPNTQELTGIKEKYENLDNRYASTTIRSGLDGNINYLFYTNRYVGILIGFLTIMKASSKPVIVKIDSGPVKRGKIYYRYPAQVAEIEAADLRRIIDEEVSDRVNKFIESIQKIKEIGIDNVALVNTESGEVDLGNRNSQKLVLNEDTLKKLNLIKYGKLVAKDGAPAYVIKGESEVEAATRPILSKEADIYESFFNQVCEHPNLMLQQLTFSSSQYNPLFFLIYKANITKAAASELINSIEGADVVIKTKHEVLKRIENDSTNSLYQEGVLISFLQLRIESDKALNESIQLAFDTHNEIKSSERAKVIRTLVYNNLINKINIPDELYEDHLKRILEAASHLSIEFIIHNKEYVLEQMQKMYLLISVMKPTESTLIRKVICNIDRALYLSSIPS